LRNLISNEDKFLNNLLLEKAFSASEIDIFLLFVKLVKTSSCSISDLKKINCSYFIRKGFVLTHAMFSLKVYLLSLIFLFGLLSFDFVFGAPKQRDPCTLAANYQGIRWIGTTTEYAQKLTSFS
jgi:hypothetical protein